jgi:hypothetical protein
MMGLMYLGAFTLYFVLMFVVVRGAWRLGRKDGGTKVRGLAFAGVGFLVVYLPVFWNLVPLEMVFRKKCATDAGFVAIKPPEQWAAENGARLVSLSNVDPYKMLDSRTLAPGLSRHEFLGGLLAREYLVDEQQQMGMTVTRTESRLIDVSTDALLAKSANYSVGPSGDLRVWLLRQSCFEPEDSPVFKDREYLQTVVKGIK